MSDSDNETGDAQEEYRMYATLGSLTLEIEGNDKEWVADRFEESWETRLQEASEMKEALRRADVSAQ